MDKIFVDEAVNELQTIQDMLRWSVSRFSAANIWYGHGTDNPWDEAVQLVLPSLYLPLDIPEDMRTARLTSSEKHRIVERVIRRVNERIPVAYLPNEYRHEPELGLASGTDGLKLTRRILGNAADYLADDGVLICEVGNSMVHLMEQYPDVPFTWLEFDNGGDGVFMLTKEQLLAAREYFAIYKD